MTEVESLAAFAAGASNRLAHAVADTLKRHLLDALGCAIGALDAGPMSAVRELAGSLGGTPSCALIGGGRTAPDRAAFNNGALVRYLDFNDAYLAPGETCHPSDNVGAVLAAAEHARGSGSNLLAALAVAYHVECRLADEAPVRKKGFDHTTLLAYAAAAGICRALGLGARETAHAIAMSGAASNSLRVTRTGRLSQWKGLAAADTAAAAMLSALLARRGVTGPLEIFEGPSGFHDVFGGAPIDWSREVPDRVNATILKKYNAEIHAQSTVEAILSLRGSERPQAAEIERIDIETFDVAFQIIGGGQAGDKLVVETKEDADHSLPYMAAAALLDGELRPQQYTPDRIRSRDVQSLLRCVTVRGDPEFTRQFPEHMPSRVRIVFTGRPVVEKTVLDYEGFRTRPMEWPAVIAKFDRLASGLADPGVNRAIIEVVLHLEQSDAATLGGLLGRAQLRHRQPRVARV